MGVLLVATVSAQISVQGGSRLSNGGVGVSLNAIYFKAIQFVTPDISPPIISNLAEVVNNESANITWTTDELANYTLRLSTGDSFSNATFAISFFQNLTNITNGTLFEYNITACDQSGNCNTTTNFQFITDNNAGLFIQFPEICTDSAIINVSCTFISNIVNCTNFTIFNLTGTRINNGTYNTLPFGSGTVKQFEFNQSEGEYVVSSCGTHFKDIKVVAEATDDNMAFSGIGILYVGMMFFVIYVGNAIITKDDQGNIIQINKIMKFILFSLGLFILYFASQLAYGIALENSFTGNITASLSTTNWLVMIMAFVVLVLITWGTFINELIRFKDWLMKQFGMDPNRRRKQ